MTRVLYVEDEALLAIAMEGAMQNSGFDVQLAHDGDEVVAHARDFQPEIIVTDYMMPRVDGYDVARSIRARSWGDKVRVVGLTGWGHAEDRRPAPRQQPKKQSREQRKKSSGPPPATDQNPEGEQQ